MILQQLNILEDNDRIYAARTPSKKLILDKRCTVYPPQWGPDAKGLRPVIEFNCDRPAPQLYLNQVYEKSANREIFPCLICGDLVQPQLSNKCIECNTLTRGAHLWCLKRACIQPKQFKCSLIKEHYAPVELGKPKLRQLEPLSPLEDPPRFRCLICGDNVANWEPLFRGKRVFSHDNTTVCKHVHDTEYPCPFSIHNKCAEFHDLLVYDDKFDPVEFECNLIIFQVRPQVIEHLQSKPPRTVKAKKEAFTKFHRIRVNSDKRKRRYINPSTICKHCGEEVPLTQKWHLFHHCTAIKSDPPAADIRGDLRSVVKRCLEIGRLRYSCETVCSRKRVKLCVRGRDKPLAWGMKDGESITELNNGHSD